MPLRRLGGTPSDRLPDVLAVGGTDVSTIFVSMSARQAEGRDAEYLEWHSLDHRPEQYRIPGLRHSLRLVSTPTCRERRIASESPYDAVDHVMTYFFTDAGALHPFAQLSDALPAERRPLVLPSIEYGVFDLAGTSAAPRAVTGADVIPWRPALGVFLLVERGAGSPAALVEIEGVVGAWWGEGSATETPFRIDRRSLQITYLFLDEEPEAVAELLISSLQRRWAHGPVPLLAAPFRVVVPFEWDRNLP
jgi:hypothetical protein